MFDAPSGLLVVEGTADSSRPMRLYEARGFRARLVGLIGQRQIPQDAAFLLSPCDWVHTIAMSVPIDVVYLDGDWQVLDVDAEVPPWRILRRRPGARAVLEMASGSAFSYGLVPNVKLRRKLQETCPRGEREGTLL